jgi:hypothetical protein
MIALPLDSGLAQLQRAFSEAIFFDSAPVPATIRTTSGRGHASRFGVYRNNVFAGLINAIAARYPVTRKLLWDDAFNRVAHCYVATEPPRSPVLLNYGETFPQFLRSVGQGVAADYLADIAALEATRTRAYHAADAAPLDREAFTAIPTEQWPDVRGELHPSVELLKSAFPIVSIWQANRNANDNILGAWTAECALVARPHLQVEVWPVPVGVYEFLTALAAGQSVGAAISKAKAGASDFDLGECFKTLISAEIVVGLAVSKRRGDRHI